jgi:hypothetical protein
VKLRDIKEEFIDLFRTIFGDDMSSDLWEWKYIQNPFSVGDSQIVVALDKGKVVGARPFMLAQMWINDRKVRVAQPSDTMVHPEYRRMGLFSRMNELGIQFLRAKEYALIFNFPGDMSRPGYLKQGWRLISNMETVFQVSNPANVISHKSGSKFLGVCLGPVYRLMLGARKKRTSGSVTGFRVGVSDHFSDELEEVDSVREKWGIDLVRSGAYMRWRFDEHPEHKYEYIIAKERDEVLGYAVIRIPKESERLRRGMVVDYLVKDSIDCFRDLMTECVEQLSKECDIISTWASWTPGFTDELQDSGFKTPSKFPYNRMFPKRPLVAREVDTQVIGGFDIYRKDNWRVTPAYVDTA